jgi:hypothetical protein
MRKKSELLKPVSKHDPKPDPKELSFCCPECGSARLTLIQTDVRMYQDVISMYDDGEVELRDPLCDVTLENDDPFYECAVCSYHLRNEFGFSIHMEDDLVRWLQKNCKQP